MTTDERTRNHAARAHDALLDGQSRLEDAVDLLERIGAADTIDYARRITEVIDELLAPVNPLVAARGDSRPS